MTSANQLIKLIAYQEQHQYHHSLQLHLLAIHLHPLHLH